jgi:hypothetical protein
MFDMESNNFDNIIRKKLQNLEVEYQAGDWELMEQKLNIADVDANPEFEDVILDGIAYGSLENYKVNYEPAHWNLMEQKLDNAAYPIRRKLYRYKVAEVSLMLLAIFTVIQFLPFKKQKTTESAGIEIQIESQTAKDLLNSKILSENKTSNLPSAEKPSIDFENAENLAAATETSNIDDNVLAYSEKAIPLKPEVGLMVRNDSGGDDLNAADIPKLTSNQFTKKHLDLSIANRFAFENKANQTVSLLLPINAYKPDKLSVANASSDLPGCLGCNSVNSSFLISIGMAGGVDADYITTPYDGEYHQKEYGQVAMGYGGGLTLGFKYHKWELETGAIYSAKYYGTRNIFEVNGSFQQGGYVQQGLLGVQLDIVKVPLHLRYNFMDRSKWNFYAQSGASFNMTVETLYEYTSETIGNSSALAGRRADPHPNPTYDGIFEGGNLIDNTFITANLGLGIERHFNSRMSVFLGSTYQHQITKGLGPQSDKINSLSIMTGARVTLKSKKKK